MVRVRFAPSPTGALHIGGVRTALYNYLFAKKMGGVMLLRIEDTDSARFVEGAERYIIDALNWCGIVIDEGVGVGGPYAPYKQSERKEIYLKYALDLVASGWAYYAFDTSDELSSMRAAAEADKQTFCYNFTIREELKTSLNMSAKELEEQLAAKTPYVIRFKMPSDETIEMDDMVRGKVVVDSSTLDDKVLYKSHDGLPTYHLANIVDDHLMQISHVIRGEEWLPSLPLHYMLYKAFGWQRPQFAHLPLILKPDGKGKLSKRDGDKLGFAVFPLEWRPSDGESARGFREDGYLPAAFINMLALLGWSPGGDKEIMSIDDMVADFSIDKIGKAGARYDPDKARWFNAEYLHAMPNSELAQYLQKELTKEGVDSSGVDLEKVCELIKPRAVLLTDLVPLSRFYFVTVSDYDMAVVEKFWKGENPSYVAAVRDILASVDDFSQASTEANVKSWIASSGAPMGGVMNSLRLAIVGGSGGASVFAITEVIGKNETLQRLDNLLSHNF